MKASMPRTVDFKTVFQCKNSQSAVIADDDSSYSATVYSLSGQEIGSMEFSEVEFPQGTALKLVWGYLDKLNGQYLHQGIGRQILKLVATATECRSSLKTTTAHQRMTVVT